MTDDGIIPLLISAGMGGTESLELRFPPEYADEISELLDEAGLSHGSTLAHSELAELAIETVKVVVVSGGFAASVASFYRTFAQRHQGKRVKFDENGTPVEFDGFPLKTVEKFIEKQAEEQAARDTAAKAELEED